MEQDKQGQIIIEKSTSLRLDCNTDMVFQLSTQCSAAHIWVVIIIIIIIIITIITIIIIIIIIISHFPPLNDVSWVLLCHVSANTQIAQKHNTFLGRCAVLSMAHICAQPMISGIPSFSCHVLASLDIVPNAPTTMGMTLTCETWCMCCRSDWTFRLNWFPNQANSFQTQVNLFQPTSICFNQGQFVST